MTGTITPGQFPDWAAPADVDVTVVRTPLGVAETGSILLTEKELGVNTIAVLARHLVVLLDPADLVENIHLAYRHPSFTQAAYAVLLSRPSGSADIGGVTVHPAQGVTTLTALLTPRTTPDPAAGVCQAEGPAGAAASPEWSRCGVVGPPLRARDLSREQITPVEGLPALSLDALTSVAYGPEAIIVVLAVAGAGTPHLVLPITIAIVALLAILVFSYRQVIDGYALPVIVQVEVTSPKRP
ncbi:MAG: hypothetical protein JO242_14455 [Streptosporangiaceae bacterium]|nr:hypothetical protein [Streptosporangiaceae bacterium]